MPLPLPRNAAEISAAWLNEVLAESLEFGGAKIDAVESTVIGEGIGYLSSMARVKLLYDQPAARARGRPVVSLACVFPCPSQQLSTFASTANERKAVVCCRSSFRRVAVVLPAPFIRLRTPDPGPRTLDFGRCLPFII
jgi:hypothetical protein